MEVEGAGSGGEAHEPRLRQCASDFAETVVSSPSGSRSIDSDSAPHLDAGASGGARRSGGENASTGATSTGAESTGGDARPADAGVRGPQRGAQVGGGKQQMTSSQVTNRPVASPSARVRISRRMRFEDDEEPPPLPRDVEVRGHVCARERMCICVRACVCRDRKVGSMYRD